MNNETEQKIRELCSNGVSCKDIASQIGYSYSGVKRFLNKNGLPSNPQKYGIPKEYYKDIQKLYEQGNTSLWIQENIFPQFTEDQITYVVRSLGISRARGKAPSFNEDYFKVIDTEKKAYFLGLITADGCINIHGTKKSVSISLIPEDKYLLEALLKDCNSKLTVKEYTNNSGFGDSHKEAKVILNSSKCVSYLISYGIVPQKSKNLKDMPEIPYDLMNHYIRGFFDGNGTVCSISHNGYEYIRYAFYSTYAFCEKLNDLLSKELNEPKKRIYTPKTSDQSFITFDKTDTIYKLYNYLYHNATIYMKRKKDKADELFRKHRDNS